MNFSKELWFALFFLVIGFTIWPLMIYYLGLSLSLEFFLQTTLRVWAEDIIYGPLGTFDLNFLISLLFLSFPYLFFNFLRLVLKRS
jgi:hypothetical protein